MKKWQMFFIIGTIVGFLADNGIAFICALIFLAISIPIFLIEEKEAGR